MAKYEVPKGCCFTAMVTPFNSDGSIDWLGLEMNTAFQIKEGVKGVVPVGTTGESPTLTPREHVMVIGRVAQCVDREVFLLAGCGSNSTKEMLEYGEAALAFEADGLLLVDCYYNGPSSLELREEYYKPAAEKFPDLVICPYIIPGRTGCALSEYDLAFLARKYPNLTMVKEATGDLERMGRTRTLTPEGFLIFSGDDHLTFKMMTDPKIRADGVISVISNIAPKAVERMCEAAFAGVIEEAQKFKDALDPLFEVVTVRKERREEFPEEFTVEDKFRNPLPIKTMMQGLGMRAGPCRPPLGKMTSSGVEKVRNALKEVWDKNPEVLKPIEAFYGVKILNRLRDDEVWKELTFTD